MAAETEQQIALLAWNAGFRGPQVAVATAIAEAESRGYTNAYNPETAAGTKPGMGSYGLWQIYRTAHPQYSPTYLYNAADNASAAYAISQGGANWQPWTTYTGWTSGGYITPPYLAFMPSALQAVKADFGTSNPGTGRQPIPGAGGGGSAGGGGVSNAPPPTPEPTVTDNYANPFGYACALITEQQSILYGPFALDSWNIAGFQIPYGDVLNMFNAAFQRGLAAVLGLIIMAMAFFMLVGLLSENTPEEPAPPADTANAAPATPQRNYVRRVTQTAAGFLTGAVG